MAKIRHYFAVLPTFRRCEESLHKYIHTISTRMVCLAQMTPRKAQKKRKPWSSSWLVPAAVVVLGAFILLALPKTKESPKVENTNTAKPRLSIATTDGITLSAELTLPSGTAVTPAVILIHDFATDRHQWDPYISKFTAAGFAVLTYDIRGFGASKLPAMPTDQTTWMNSMPNDIPAIMHYLQLQPRINANQISVVGAGFGARVAYVASGSQLGIHRTVLLSPHLVSGILDGANITNFSPTGVFAVSDIEGAADVEPLIAYTHDPKLSFETDNGRAAGVKLLDDASVRPRVLSWLKP